MGWIISVILFVTSCLTSSELLMIASGLFAIAGSIGLKEGR